LDLQGTPQVLGPPRGPYREGRAAAPPRTLPRTARSQVTCRLSYAPHSNASSARSRRLLLLFRSSAPVPSIPPPPASRFTSVAIPHSPFRNPHSFRPRFSVSPVPPCSSWLSSRGSRLSDHSAFRTPDLIPRFPGSPFLQRALSPSLPVSPAPRSSLHRPRPFAEGAAGEAKAAAADMVSRSCSTFPTWRQSGRQPARRAVRPSWPSITLSKMAPPFCLRRKASPGDDGAGAIAPGGVKRKNPCQSA